MIAAIENKILAWLSDAGLGIRHTDVKEGTSIQYPAVFVFTQAGDFDKVGQAAYRCDLSVFVLALFRDVRSEKDRRHGVYPILEGIIKGLMFSRLDLDIKPLKPKTFRNITDADMQAAGVICFQIEFSTSYLFAPDKETAEDLLRIGLEYFLHDPNDGTADASDMINLTIEEE